MAWCHGADGHGSGVEHRRAGTSRSRGVWGGGGPAGHLGASARMVPSHCPPAPRPSWDPRGSRRHPNDGTVPVPRAVTALAPLRKPGGDITVTFPGLPQTPSRNPELGNPGKGSRAAAPRGARRRGLRHGGVRRGGSGMSGGGFPCSVRLRRGEAARGSPPRGAARSPSHPILLQKHGEQGWGALLATEGLPRAVCPVRAALHRSEPLLVC